MRKWHGEKRPRARIEIIPMIDVMMFLLVFFVLISLNVIPAQGIKTRLPQSSHSEHQNVPHNVVVTLAKSGDIQLDGQPATLESLSAQLRERQQQTPDLAVIINGDQTTEIQRLIDVMDSIKSAGLEAISIAARKKATE